MDVCCRKNILGTGGYGQNSAGKVEDNFQIEIVYDFCGETTIVLVVNAELIYLNTLLNQTRKKRITYDCKWIIQWLIL